MNEKATIECLHEWVIGDRIQKNDEWVSWIKELFARWANEAISDATINPRTEIKTLDIKKWEILIIHNASWTSRHAKVLGNIWWNIVQIGSTQVDMTDKDIRWSFLWAKWTKLEGIKMNFQANNIDDLDKEAQSWIKTQLSVYYPNDYESNNKLSETEEEYIQILDGIKFTLRSWIEWKKEASIRLEIWDEIFEIDDFWFLPSWQPGNQTFKVWIKPKWWAETKITAQLKNKTESSQKDFKRAIHQMLRNVRRLLETKDTRKQLLAHEIRKYLVTDKFSDKNKAY